MSSQNNNQNNNNINVIYDPNTVLQNLILELSKKKASLTKQLNNLRLDCKLCRTNAYNVALKKAEQYDELQKKYDYDKQLMNGSPIIYNVSPQLNQLKFEIENAKNMMGVPFCKNHIQLGRDLADLHIEIQSLEESINIFNKK